MILLGVFNLLIIATPYIHMHNPAGGELLHGGFSFTCHQLAARSYCVYPDGSIADCPHLYTKDSILETEEGPAYKFPVCARDLPLYLAAFLGGIAVYFTKWRDSKVVPNPIYFIIALIPIALDGGTQFIGLRESTNLMRAITGGIAGFAFSFYIIPLLNMFFSKREETKKENKEKEKKAT